MQRGGVAFTHPDSSWCILQMAAKSEGYQPRGAMSLLRLDQRMGTTYMEHARVVVVDGAVAAEDTGGVYHSIQVEASHALILGPGSTVSHAAIRLASRAGCGIAFVAADQRFVDTTVAPLTSKLTLATAQARAVRVPSLRLATARRMLATRFGQAPPTYASGTRLLGWEGAQMRKQYRHLATTYGISWKGRCTDRPWEELDDANRLLSTATPVLYAAVAITCNALRLHPDLGVVHVNQPRGFIFDLADIYREHCVIRPVFACLADGTLTAATTRVAVLAALEAMYWPTVYAKLATVLEPAE